MPHYRSGGEAAIGDLVKGKGYNLKGPDGQLREIIGTVESVTPGPTSCNIRVREESTGQVEYGQCDHFELITPAGGAYA